MVKTKRPPQSGRSSRERIEYHTHETTLIVRENPLGKMVGSSPLTILSLGYKRYTHRRLIF
jgi:hypothetical protein